MYRPLTGVPGTGVMGVVYLVHFERPYRHARHYWGWAQRLEARMSHHEAGTGARLLAVVKEVGIPWQVALVEPGDKNRERQRKNQGGAARTCPICKEEKRGKKTVLRDLRRAA